MLTALIVPASAVGPLSEGPVSKTRLGDPSRLQVELQRFTHVDTPTRIHVRMAENDILEAARRWRGLENMSQIRYAVLEKDGNITIIPFAPGEQVRS